MGAICIHVPDNEAWGEHLKLLSHALDVPDSHQQRLYCRIDRRRYSRFETRITVKKKDLSVEELRATALMVGFKSDMILTWHGPVGASQGWHAGIWRALEDYHKKTLHAGGNLR